MAQNTPSHIEEAEVPKEQLAYEFCKQNPGVSQRKVAKEYGISESTLNDRIHGVISARQQAENRQILHPAEERASFRMQWTCCN